MHKRIHILPILLVLLGLVSTAAAESPSSPSWRLLAGYKGLELDYTYRHDTHPDDGFLPSAGIPGSAGTTRLDGRADFLLLGIGYQIPVARSLWLNLDAGGLIGSARDEHKNANDSRPDANGAFVYSAAKWGWLAAAGLTYRVTERFYAGAEAQLAGVSIESGWDRYSNDERKRSSMEVYPSVGPKLGYAFSDHFAIEGSAQLGRTNGVSLNTVWMF